MKHQLITTNNNDSQHLIIYFAGWGTPPELIENWKRPDHYDVLICWDYYDLSLDFDFSQYANKHIHLLAWSMGVWAAENSLNHVSLTSATAVNGTPPLIHDDFGIPMAIYDGTLNGFNDKNKIQVRENTREKFERRMCGGREQLQNYKKFPQRDIDNLTNELQAVKDTVVKQQSLKTHDTIKPNITWSRIFIGDKDGIFPTKNQQAYWNTVLERPDQKKRIELIEAPHEAISYWHDFSTVLTALDN